MDPRGGRAHALKVSEAFEVAQPVATVWALFQDVPAVVSCLPGARLGESLGEGRYRGALAVKLGPIQTNFSGDAALTPDPATRSGQIAGQGVDKKGGSRGRMEVRYRLSDTVAGTRVEVDADFSLAGRAAQFGRVGLIQELTSRLLGEFATNLEARLRASSGA